jgi:ribonuclease HI
MTISITIYTDGAARGNPGRSASGFIAFDSNGKQLAKEWIDNGIGTNNEAEYNAIILALKWCLKTAPTQPTKINLFSDSELIVNQLLMRYKAKAKALAAKRNEAQRLAKNLPDISFSNVPRETEGIRKIDKYLNQMLDKAEKRKKCGQATLM